MPGFDCEFIEEPPKAFQSGCPVCKLILREPFQVTCCGKSFCRQCIQQVEAQNKPCPTCNEASFDSFRNRGLQQPLYGFQVFCSNKESGCDWQGELGQLDQHLNLNPDKDKLSVGCAYAEVNCLYCSEPRPRHEIEHHQTSKCAERPFTCSLCEYKSTYADVVTSHSPVCKCRPVECPNSCGTNSLQHQHLEEHIYTQCPLSYVGCEFSDAGCDAMVYRKDLPSHLGENVVTHVSLLARESKKLKLHLKIQSVQLKEHLVQLKEQSVHLGDQTVQLKEQSMQLNDKSVQLEEQSVHLKEQSVQLDDQSIQLKKQSVQLEDLTIRLAEQSVQLKEQAVELKQQEKKSEAQVTMITSLESALRSGKEIPLFSNVPPMDLCSNLKLTKRGETWRSKPFYSHIGGYKLQLEVRFLLSCSPYVEYKYRFNILDSEFDVPPSGVLQITLQISDTRGVLRTDKQDVVLGSDCSEFYGFEGKGDTTDFRVLQIVSL